MPKRLERQMERLKNLILGLGGQVEQNLHLAFQAFENRDTDVANRIVEGDGEINRLEVDLEEECLKVLALYQPVAVDLRYIIAILKINNDLERIGDQAVNIANRAGFLSAHKEVHIPFDLAPMAQKAQGMIKQSLDALVKQDSRLARSVLAADAQVDQMNRDFHEDVIGAIRRDATHIECFLHVLLATRHLERVADLATNIAEDVIYLVEGEIVRHRP